MAVTGLTTDDRSLHDGRIKLWNDFNHAWLAMFQKQKETMESMQPSQPSQGLISRDVTERMGKELVRLCDSVERQGLVDYEYGVWEERILAGKSLAPRPLFAADRYPRHAAEELTPPGGGACLSSHHGMSGPIRRRQKGLAEAPARAQARPARLRRPRLGRRGGLGQT